MQLYFPTHRTALVLLVILLFPVTTHADGLTFTKYSVTPSTIYPTASPETNLATSSTIVFGLSEKAKVSLKILDASGASIKTVYSSSGVTNPDPKVWDGKNTSGAVVPFGVYTVQISAATSSLSLLDVSKTITVAAPPVTVPPSPETVFEVPLSVGWNLISVPVTPNDTRLEKVLGEVASSIDSVWAYDPGDPTASQSGWLIYEPAHPEISTLRIMTSGYGYFIHAHTAATLSISGSLFSIGDTPPERALHKGWNLVGSFANVVHGIGDTFASIGFKGLEYTALWKLDTETGRFETPEEVRAGEGYWIYLDAPHTYVPANL